MRAIPRPSDDGPQRDPRRDLPGSWRPSPTAHRMTAAEHAQLMALRDRVLDKKAIDAVTGEEDPMRKRREKPIVPCKQCAYQRQRACLLRPIASESRRTPGEITIGGKRYCPAITGCDQGWGRETK